MYRERPEEVVNLESAEQPLSEATSFLEIEDKSREKSKALSMIKTLMMMKLGPSKRRYTEDGRVCSKAFSFNGKAYTDCTTDLSPDGNMGKEWCFVSTQGKGEKFWSWCKPTMDWDQIREKNQDEMKKVSVKGRMVYEEIEKWIKPGLEIIETIKKIRNGQADLEDKINKLSNDVTGIGDALKNMKELGKQWSAQEDKIVKLSDNIENLQSKEKDPNVSKKPQTIVNISPEIIKLEKEVSGVVVNVLVQTKTIVINNDCSGLLNYEDEPLGDGLNASFFDNENFQGKAIESKEGPIEFNWTGSSPIQGINAKNYSVKFQGYLYIPYTSYYRFAIECDDNARLLIGGKRLIKHGFYAARETYNTVENWLRAESNKRQNAGKGSDRSVSPDPIYLIGGSKVPILVEYSHSQHNDIFEEEKAFLNLYWESECLEEMIISKRYLYADNSPSPVKISSGGSSDKSGSGNGGVMRKLIENDMAFKDTDKYMIMDIPRVFLGLPCLKLDSKYTDKEINFSVSEPSIVYVGVMDHFPNPLRSDWDETGQYMTLMEINQEKSSKFPGKIYGERSTVLRIMRKKYRSGNIRIPLDLKSINTKGVSLIVFFGADDDAPVECGGEEIWISEPEDSKGHYKECTESSRLNNFWACRQGLLGRFVDKEGNMWASKNEGVNAWLQVNFNNLYQVTKIEYQNRNNPNERNSKITAFFSGDEPFEMVLKNNAEKTTYKVEPPILTSLVKFVVNSVYGTINNGGSFKVYGMKCPRKDEVEVPGSVKIASLFSLPDNTVLPINCNESVINASAKFASIKKSPGNSVSIKCNDNCANFSGNIYGSGQYSVDSVICKAAYHSMKLPEDGGLIKLIFQRGLNTYKDDFMRGLQSNRKQGGDLSISFDEVEDDNVIKLQTGIKVDAKVGRVWKKGIIIDVKETATGKIVQITIEETDGGKPISYPHPSENLKPCGDMIKSRDCVGSRKKFVNQAIKIRFAPSTYTKTGDTMVDNGEVFGRCGKSYGWNMDMTNNMRQKDGAKQIELETFAEFNYSQKSKKCEEVSPEISCENATWTMKVGHGKFNVKLYFGQPFQKSTVSFIIQDIPVALNRMVDSGTLDMIDKTVDSVDEKITIRGDCFDNCKDTRTILNMVEVKPVLENQSDDDAGLAVNASSCNNAKKGGNCNTGKGDILHCLYDNPQSPGASSCGGTNIFLKVSPGYRCLDQTGKYKCVKRTYENSEECSKFCPQTCKKSKCFY